jgi:hypothetical protein
MLHGSYLDIAYGCNGFQVVSDVFSSVLEACFKCFNCLQTYVAIVVFGCLKSRSGVASLLLSPFAASSLPEPAGHPYDAAAGPFRIGGAARPSPLVTQATLAPRAARNGRGRGL